MGRKKGEERKRKREGMKERWIYVSERKDREGEGRRKEKKRKGR